jgi:hypothetical protein
MRDEIGDMFNFPGVLGAIWLDSTEDPDASLSFVLFEDREALEANGKDPRFREGLKPVAEVLERLPPELHIYNVDLAKLRRDPGQAR